MDEMCGFHNPTANDYSDKVLFTPENLTPAEYRSFDYTSAGYDLVYGSPDDLISEAASSSITPGVNFRRLIGDEYRDDHDDALSVIKTKIASHPRYTKLLQAYIDCQKVGAPPDISCLLDEIRRENDLYKRDLDSTCAGVDPELDDFMETFCDVLVKYKSDLSRPFDEATAFLNQIEFQLRNLCTDEGAGSSDEEFSGIENEGQEAQTSEDRELKERLLHKYGSHIGGLKLEFSKKKKKGKLPKEARQTLLEWWHLHYKWPYPTEADKISLAETTGLDQRQINNWFINQRKRHWKPSENMQLAFMGNISGQLSTDD